MMSKSKKPVSVSFSDDMKELLESSYKHAGYASKSALVRELAEKYLDLLVNDGSISPVVLRIPTCLKEDPEKLRQWLNVKVDVIVKLLT